MVNKEPWPEYAGNTNQCRGIYEFFFWVKKENLMILGLNSILLLTSDVILAKSFNIFALMFSEISG